MKKMRAVQVAGPKKPLELIEREIPSPTRGTVRVKIQACGICHSDIFTKEGLFPGLQYPRVPGHEIAGVIDAVGEEAGKWKVGQRVGIGWYAGHCGICPSCRRGDFMTCFTPRISGVSYDGGYAEYMIAPREALALIPETLSPVEAAPLMCAGVTTFNALRRSGAIAAETIAILGVGGLGHLAVQFAAKMGFRTVAIARGKEKGALSKQLGAHHCIDSESQNVGEELKKLGGAKVILSTVTNAAAVNATIDGLSIDGKLLIVGVPEEPLSIPAMKLIAGRQSVQGWPCGTSIDSEDTLSFSALHDIRSMNHLFPLEKAVEAYEFMMSGKARFRVVLQTGL
jgi:D-arabinose 1-dehydrogenase-like Zn-dependent alcohol dehydrogenase